MTWMNSGFIGKTLAVKKKKVLPVTCIYTNQTPIHNTADDYAPHTRTLLFPKKISRTNGRKGMAILFI